MKPSAAKSRPPSWPRSRRDAAPEFVPREHWEADEERGDTETRTALGGRAAEKILVVSRSPSKLWPVSRRLPTEPQPADRRSPRARGRLSMSTDLPGLECNFPRRAGRPAVGSCGGGQETRAEQ